MAGIFLCGCAIPSVSHWARNAIGMNIEKFKRERPADSYASRIGWKEKSYLLDNGNWMYVYPIRPDCNVHFEVNTKGIITGFKTEGTECY